ncbi:MAG: molybdenum cofactor guanylyltransferase MobA [Hyphomicrobiaceae bacterium]|nr:molybdenum cofactor guanylyltransferase MobA [Hyphomicrobiaceae bacterium]
MNSPAQRSKPVGIILAGGRSSRMGVEKSLIELEGRALLQWGIERFRGQVCALAINANGYAGRFSAFDLPVIADPLEGQMGPLAGILAGMMWARKHHAGASHIATIASDTPFFPADFVERLQQGLEGEEGRICIPSSANRLHPAFGLWPVALAGELESWLIRGERRVQSWLREQAAVRVDFPPNTRKGGQIDPFFNINAPADLQTAVDWCAQSSS